MPESIVETPLERESRNKTSHAHIVRAAVQVYYVEVVTMQAKKIYWSILIETTGSS